MGDDLAPVDVAREFAHRVPVWVRPDSGETVEGDCPRCASTREEAEAMVREMELANRRLTSRMTRMKNDFERQQAARRDAEEWGDVCEFWLRTFPELKPRTLGIKSERATAFFTRLETGVSVQDVKDAITGASRYRYVLFGRRVEKASGQAALAIDLTEICHLKADRWFDFLLQAGRTMREKEEVTNDGGW